MWCCDVMHEINTEYIQCGVSEVFKCIGHENHIECVVQLIVFTSCLDIEGFPQFHHVIIFIMRHHFTLHIIITLFARWYEGIVQR